VKGPAITGSRRWVCVPELRLEELSARCIEAAEVLHDSRIVAAQLRHRAALCEAAHDAASTTKEDLRATDCELAECADRRHGCLRCLRACRLEGSGHIMYLVPHSVDPGFHHGRHVYYSTLFLLWDAR
jgi:hypothetical protein